MNNASLCALWKAVLADASRSHLHTMMFERPNKAIYLLPSERKLFCVLATWHSPPVYYCAASFEKSIYHRKGQAVLQKKFAAPESLACPIEFFGDVYSMLIHIHMFTGIIEKTSRILSAETRGRCRRVTLEKPEGWKLAPGESISIDGICSTVTARTRDRFDVEYMPETLSKTTAALFTAWRIVNLERSLRYGDRVHGHFVAGHVDGRGRIVAVKKEEIG